MHTNRDPFSIENRCVLDRNSAFVSICQHLSAFVSGRTDIDSDCTPESDPRTCPVKVSDFVSELMNLYQNFVLKNDELVLKKMNFAFQNDGVFCTWPCSAAEHFCDFIEDTVGKFTIPIIPKAVKKLTFFQKT